MLVKAGGRGLTLGLQARGGLGGGGRGELKPVLRNQKQVKLAVVAMLEMSTGFQSQVAAVEMWWTVHLEGGPRRVNHAAVAMGERVFSFGEPLSKYFEFPSFSAAHCSGGYCTGDNYRDERPIDVFVLNTSNYRWTEVVTCYLKCLISITSLCRRCQNLKMRWSEQSGLIKGCPKMTMLRLKVVLSQLFMGRF